MGMGGGAFGAMTQALQGTMQNSPNYVDRRGLYGPDDRPLGSTGSMGGMMGPQNATYANTTPNLAPYSTTPNLSGGSNPYAVNTGASNPGLGSSRMQNSGGGGGGGPFPLQGQYGIVKMAGGGLAGAAQTMADKGRNGDSMLVHMTPGEVKGLQQLAMAQGGSLSINPDTGLPEANFLKRMLPMIAGAALSPFVTPMGAAAIVGGFEGIRTGDVGKGLMAGLGAYGGAGLAGNISNAGAAATETAATTSGNQAVANLGAAEVEAGGSLLNAQKVALDQGSQGLSTLQTQQMQEAAKLGYSPDQLATMGGRMQAYNTAPTGLDAYTQGAKQVFSSPQSAMTFGKDNLMNIGAAAAPLAMAAEEGGAPNAIPGLDEKYKRPPYSYELSPDFKGYTPDRPRPYYRPRGLGYAEGGMTYDDEPGMDMAAGGITGYRSGGLKIGEGIATDSDPDTASLGAQAAGLKRREKNFAAANLKPTAMPKTNLSKLGEIKTGIAAAAGGGSIGGYSDGGRMLKGPGDGMSDSIPATIGRRQPARLADGEFVVPADVVSHLGNGSTDAGAKRLYAMMDKVRTARTGKKKQAPAVKADKYLPK
jgi:hypothetical protein